MRKILNSYFYLLVMIVFATPAFANTTSPDKMIFLQVGLQGGGTYHFTPTESMIRGDIGTAAALSFELAHYKPKQNVDLGFKTGFSVGFMQSAYIADFVQQYSNIDYLGNQMDYTTSGVVNIQQQQTFATVPLMFALRSRGVVWNIGMRLQAGLSEFGKQQLSNAVIKAYYPEYGVEVTNELITGVVKDDQLSMSIKRYSLALDALATTELGYEHSFKANSALGILVYCNVGIWNNLPKPTNEPIIYVNPISNAQSPVPSVKINDAQCSLLSHDIPLQFGLKLYYSFSL